jgi:MYXO-CTERM domain-containing protein
VTDSGSPLADAGGPIDSGARTDARVLRDATDDHGGGESSGGCACRTPARDARGGSTSLVVAALALAAWSRRKRIARG